MTLARLWQCFYRNWIDPHHFCMCIISSVFMYTTIYNVNMCVWLVFQEEYAEFGQFALNCLETWIDYSAPYKKALLTIIHCRKFKGFKVLVNMQIYLKPFINQRSWRHIWIAYTQQWKHFRIPKEYCDAFGSSWIAIKKFARSQMVVRVSWWVVDL